MNTTVKLSPKEIVDKINEVIENKELQDKRDGQLVYNTLATQQRKNHQEVGQLIATILAKSDSLESGIASVLLAIMIIQGLQSGDIKTVEYVAQFTFEEVDLVNTTAEEANDYNLIAMELAGESFSEDEILETISKRESLTMVAALGCLLSIRIQ